MKDNLYLRFEIYSSIPIQLFLGVREASDIYTKRMHNLCCDNCHSHVATALGMYNCTILLF